VRVVPSRNTPIKVHPSVILQPKKETLVESLGNYIFKCINKTKLKFVTNFFGSKNL
jgi:hypothetical protein